MAGLIYLALLLLLSTFTVCASLSSAEYPLELCQERTYWRPLPKPDGVIGYGYNAIRGPVPSPILNASSYEGIRPCRLTIKTKPDGQTVVEGYRLPGYVDEYRFGDELEEDNAGDPDDDNGLKQLRFTLITYESTAQAFLDMRRRWGMIVDQETDYESLFFTLNSPVRYYGGLRFPDTLQATVREQAAAVPFYTLRVESMAGRFTMKPYRYAHFVRGFAQRLRDISRRTEVSGEKASAKGFFDEYGTHYPMAGIFGGVDERRITFTDYFDARCHRKVSIDLLATCDGLKLKYQYGYPNVRVLLRVHPGAIQSTKPLDLDAARNESWEICRHEVDPILRSASYVATAGGKLSTRLALHSTRRFPADLANVVAWRNWVEAVPAEPATVKARMAPLCELVPIVDRRPDAKLACERRLLEYLRNREHFLLANPEVCDISSGKMPVAFETKPPDFWENLLQLQSNETVATFCVPTKSFDRISPCPQAQQEQRSHYRGRQKSNRPYSGRSGYSKGAHLYKAQWAILIGSMALFTLVTKTASF